LFREVIAGVASLPKEEKGGGKKNPLRAQQGNGRKRQIVPVLGQKYTATIQVRERG